MLPWRDSFTNGSRLFLLIKLIKKLTPNDEKELKKVLLLSFNRYNANASKIFNKVSIDNWLAVEGLFMKSSIESSAFLFDSKLTIISFVRFQLSKSEIYKVFGIIDNDI